MQIVKNKMRKIVYFKIIAITLFIFTDSQFINLESRRFQTMEKLPSLLGSTINSQSQCRNIKGLGSPINIFREYIQQLYYNFAFNPDIDPPVLVYYKEVPFKHSIHYYIFKFQNIFTLKTEYIGIMSLVRKKDVENQNYQHIIIRYVDSVHFESVKILLGVHEAEENMEVPCSEMKNDLMMNMFSNPVVSDTCSEDSFNGVSYNEIQLVLRKIYFIVKNVLQIFGFEVDLSAILQDKEIFQIMEQELGSFQFLKNELQGLKRQNLINGSFSHEDIVRDSYTGDEERCKDSLDIKKECGSKTNGEDCLILSHARKIRNLMVIYVMIRTKSILKDEQIKGKFV